MLTLCTHHTHTHTIHMLTLCMHHTHTHTIHMLTAIAMAMSDSVTVSIGLLTNGVLSVIFLVSADVRSYTSE